MLFVDYSPSLVPSLLCSCLSSPVFYFSDGLIFYAASPQPSMLFLHVGLIFFCLWDYSVLTDLSGAWKEGICLDSQNEENILSKYCLMLITGGGRGRKSFKALPSNSSFLWPELLLSISGTLVAFADATAAGMQ